MKKIDPFLIEKKRSNLAKKRDYKNLKKMYHSKYAEINDENTPKLWDYLHFDKKGLLSHPMADHRNSFVTTLLKGKNKSILDIGFGSGSLERKYFKKNNSRHAVWKGIEISPLSIKKAQKEFPYADFKKGNILSLSYPNNFFDYVIALEVLEHIKPRETFTALQEIYRVIKPNSFFIVSVPMNEGLKEMIKKGENPNAHVRTYTPELLKAELEITGFSIKKEKKLFAFSRFYRIKSFIARVFLKNKFNYNNIILVAQK